MSVKHKAIFLQKDRVFILLHKTGNSNSMSFDWLQAIIHHFLPAK